MPVPATPDGAVPEAAVPAPATAAEPGASSPAGQEDLLQDAPSIVAKIRHASLGYIKAAGTPKPIEPLNRLFRRVRFLNSRASLSGMTKISEPT